MIDWFNSIKDNFAQKATNPFLATVLIVWIFKNWRFTYGLFTFDDKANQQARLDYIENYFKKYPFYPILAESVLYAFAVLIATYILLALSRLIVDFYDNKVLPRIRKMTNDQSIVTREVHQREVQARETSEKKYNEERSSRITALEERDEFAKLVTNLNVEASKVPSLTEDNEFLLKRVNELEAQNEKYILQIDKLHFKSPDEYSSPEEYKQLLLSYEALSKELEYPEKHIVEKVVAEIKAKGMENKFLQIYPNLLDKIGLLYTDESMRFFVDLGILTAANDIQDQTSSDQNHFSITNLGREVGRLLELESVKQNNSNFIEESKT